MTLMKQCYHVYQAHAVLARYLNKPVKSVQSRCRKNNTTTEVVSITNQFKFEAPDGKQRTADAIDAESVKILAQSYPNNRANKFLDWFTYSDNTTDGQSQKKAYQLYESGLLQRLEPGNNSSISVISLLKKSNTVLLTEQCHQPIELTKN